MSSYQSAGCVPWKDQAETDAGLKREFALAIINRLHSGVFDSVGRGVFKTPETMKVVEQAEGCGISIRGCR